MQFISYQPTNFRDVSLAIIDQARSIISEYAAAGYNLTLRQLYYQFVARDLFPESWASAKTGSVNNESSYDKLGSLVSNARLAGELPWDGIEDRTRIPKSLATWDTPQDIVRSAAAQFRMDKWEGMDEVVEIWVEKEALADIISKPANRWQCTYFAARGYISQSAMWRAAQRIEARGQSGQNTIIVYLGDHDPSGLDMVRDIEDRLSTFRVGHFTTMKNVALNMKQIRELNPPPNPTKLTDSRAADYVARFGYESWELDALEPSYLVNLIEAEIGRVMPQTIWDSKVESENTQRKLIYTAAEGIEEEMEGL